MAWQTVAMWIAAALLASLCGVLFARRRKLNRQLDRLAARFSLGSDEARSPEVGTLPSVDGIYAELAHLRESMEGLLKQREDEAERRRTAEIGQRQLEERYGLAIRGADDALWEWNLRTEQARFSPRWTALVGRSGEELVGNIREWWDRVHPDDGDLVQRAVQDHLAGRTSCLHSEHRLQHEDGSWRWVRVRGKLVADSMGVPVRMVGLISDITASRRVQEAVVELADGLSALSGEEGLRKLVRSFASVLGVREAFVCECSDYPTTRVRMLARWKAGEHARCVEFDLAGTACEDVIRGGHTVFAPQDAGERWPLEKQYERSSYLGLACLDSAGRVIGHIACADDKPMREDLPHQAILKIFAMRAAMELERVALERTRPVFALPLIAAAAPRYEP
jgi:PAS domain S-box-containing protein